MADKWAKLWVNCNCCGGTGLRSSSTSSSEICIACEGNGTVSGGKINVKDIMDALDVILAEVKKP